MRNNQSIWVAGQRESSVNYIIDGIETRNNRWANVSFRPSIDMINEFKIERNAYGGEIAIDGGTVVNISTKAGTNQFHGTVFEFFRNHDLNARNFFDRERAPFQDNDFGGNIGGPIVRNKLFFFGSYEGDRSRQGQTLQGLFPSPAQFQGNLADDSAGTGIFPIGSSICQANPRKCKDILDPDTRLPFPGNVVPASRISTFAQKYAPFLPAANALDRLSLGVNRLVNPPITSSWNQWSIRIDHSISSKDSIFYRYIWVNEPFFQPAINPGGGLNVPLKGRNFASGWTRIINPQLVNTLHVGWNKGDWPHSRVHRSEQRWHDQFFQRSRLTKHFNQSLPMVGSGVSLVGLPSSALRFLPSEIPTRTIRSMTRSFTPAGNITCGLAGTTAAEILRHHRLRGPATYVRRELHRVLHRRLSAGAPQPGRVFPRRRHRRLSPEFAGILLFRFLGRFDRT